MSKYYTRLLIHVILFVFIFIISYYILSKLLTKDLITSKSISAIEYLKYMFS